MSLKVWIAAYGTTWQNPWANVREFEEGETWNDKFPDESNFCQSEAFETEEKGWHWLFDEDKAGRRPARR